MPTQLDKTHQQMSISWHQFAALTSFNVVVSCMFLNNLISSYDKTTTIILSSPFTFYWNQSDSNTYFFIKFQFILDLRVHGSLVSEVTEDLPDPTETENWSFALSKIGHMREIIYRNWQKAIFCNPCYNEGHWKQLRIFFTLALFSQEWSSVCLFINYEGKLSFRKSIFYQCCRQADIKNIQKQEQDGRTKVICLLLLSKFEGLKIKEHYHIKKKSEFKLYVIISSFNGHILACSK